MYFFFSFFFFLNQGENNLTRIRGLIRQETLAAVACRCSGPGQPPHSGHKLNLSADNYYKNLYRFGR